MPTSFPEKAGLRTVALIPSSINLLKRLDLFDDYIEGRSYTFDSMKVWDSSSLFHEEGKSDEHVARVDFYEPDGMGVIVDNNVVNAAIALENERCKAFQFMQGKVVKVSKDPTQATRQLAILDPKTKETQTISSKLIIAADGPQSPLRHMLNIPHDIVQYDQRAFVCSVRTKNPSTTAYQRFLKTGPIALLPTSANTSNIIWSTNSDHARELEKMSDTVLISTINDSLLRNETNQLSSNVFIDSMKFVANQVSSLASSEGAHPLHVPEVDAILPSVPVNRGSFPLRQLHCHSYVAENFALIGDAAHCLHPFAGQGVNVGFSDAVALTRAIQYGLEHGLDIGSTHVLKSKYHDIQHPINEATITGLHYLKGFFEDNSNTASFIRGLGMATVNRFFPVKAYIHDFASYKMTLEKIGGETPEGF
eukprot:CAMPEP_0117420866 /NCGR_PEP_ID=MMETSP0758-20121206/2113_1 /TAXON_ID=63605 /ORGANISM="Percolomonas cosmopolitus, Strain AE-1 (ATCC 50343)" /LENGTH=420 /DNA_ID=CAMNT_0005202729 /DNA_START=243 /DNA_END=1505 /DNA_ORIENTATION=+